MLRQTPFTSAGPSWVSAYIKVSTITSLSDFLVISNPNENSFFTVDRQHFYLLTDENITSVEVQVGLMSLGQAHDSKWHLNSKMHQSTASQLVRTKN